MKYSRLEHRGYIGSVDYDETDEIYFGGIENCDDLILYEGESLEQLEKDFIEAVDEYYKDCKRLDRKAR